MQMYTNLKETCQEYVLMRNQKRYLQTVDEVTTAYPSPPRPSLAKVSQDHRFDTLKLSPKTIGLIPQISTILLHINPSLYRIWRLNHHGEDHSLDPLKRDIKDIKGEISLKDFREEISLKDFKEGNISTIHEILQLP
jgi:hypothetical protein